MPCGAGASLSPVLAFTPEGWAAQLDLESFAPAREAAQLIRAARRANAAAQAKVAEARAIEVARTRGAAAAGFR